MSVGWPRENGELLFVAVPAPAPGNNFALSIPSGQTWRVLAVRCDLTVTLGARSLNVAVADPFGNTAWSTSCTVTHGVGLTFVSWGIGLATAAAALNGYFSWPMPDCLVLGSATTQLVSLGNVSGADTLTNIRVLYQRWRTA